MNVTVPVGTPLVFELTVAASVTNWFGLEGFGDELTVRLLPA